MTAKDDRAIAAESSSLLPAVFNFLNKYERLLFIAGICIVVLLTGLRLVHLRADVPEPSRFARDGVLYTDEGWYAANALAYFRTGHWHVEGDLNFAVNLPVLQVIHGVFFALVGPGIEGARLTAVFSFSMTLLIAFFLIRRFEGPWAALLACLLASSNYFFFAYSRLALAENTMMMFYVLAIFLATFSEERRGYLFTAGAALAFMLSFFTKTSAVTGFPLLVLVLVLKNRDSLDKWIKPALLIVVCGVLFLLHRLLLARPYAEDHAYFHALNIGMQLNLNPLDVLEQEVEIGRRLVLLDKVLYFFFPYVLPVLLIFVKGIRRNPLILCSLFFGICYLGALSVYANLQPRYWMALMVPATAIVAITVKELYRQRAKAFPFLMLLFVIFVILWATSKNLKGIVGFLREPEYSMAEVAREIRREMEMSDAPNRVLLGHISSTLALYEDVIPVNDVYGPRPLEWRLERYQPSFLVTEGPIEDFHYSPIGGMDEEHAAEFARREEVIREHYELEELGVYSALRNYKKYRVHLYRLHPKQEGLK